MCAAYVQKVFLDSNFDEVAIDKNTIFSRNYPIFDIPTKIAFLQYFER